MLTAGADDVLERGAVHAGRLELTGLCLLPAQAGVPSSALQDVIGAGTEPEVEVEEIVEPDDSAAAATKDLLAAAAALSSEAEVFAGDGDQLPDLDDILEIDAADIESTDADTDEA